MFKKAIISALVIGGLTILNGCEPTMFGMPQSQFQSLSKEQQSQVIAGYNQRQQIKEQNQPYVDAIDMAVPAIYASKSSKPEYLPGMN